jgi:hypothetical protein
LSYVTRLGSCPLLAARVKFFRFWRCGDYAFADADPARRDWT